jgi:hypothetical protein
MEARRISRTGSDLGGISRGAWGRFIGWSGIMAAIDEEVMTA